MVNRRAALIMLLAGIAGGGLAWFLLPERASRRPVTPAQVPPDALMVAGGSLAKGSRTVTERKVALPELAGERTEGALQRAEAHPDDTPAIRAALEVQAELAAPYWAKLSPRIADAKLRAESASMIERLRVLDEPAESLARDEYALTQTLIAQGGWDTKTLAALQYLNSSSASVIQGGDPAEIPVP